MAKLNKILKNENKTFLLVLTPTINNFFISINSPFGHLHRIFNFSHIKVIPAEHRRRKVFAEEFGAYFGRYIASLKFKPIFVIKLNGLDSRSFGFLEYFIKNGGYFSEIKVKSLSSFNGCRISKQKRV